MNDQLTLFDFTRPLFSVDTPIRLIELFAGYGSQAMALRNIGANYEHYRMIEFDEPAVRSYNAIHKTNFDPMDIRDLHGNDLGITDKDRFTYLLTYSFPCTDISQAGLMMGMAEGSGTRSSLLWEVKRILSELKKIDSLPQILLMENVVAIHTDLNMPHFRRWLDYLDTLGYSTYVQDLDACDYGIAQHRERTFAVSLFGDWNYKFPSQIPLTTCIEDYFEELTEEMAMKQVVKSDKALDLLVELDEENRLE